MDRRRAPAERKAELVPLMPSAAPLLRAAAKPARSRYVRLFPERLLYLIDRLTEREFVAFCRLASEFVQLDGALAADDKRLAATVKLSPKAWAELRDKLIVLGLGRIEHGHWIDDDQLANLRIQRDASDRARNAINKRWSARNGVPDEV